MSSTIQKERQIERQKDRKKETSDKFNKHDYQTLNKCNCKN